MNLDFIFYMQHTHVEIGYFFQCNVGAVSTAVVSVYVKLVSWLVCFFD